MSTTVTDKVTGAEIGVHTDLHEGREITYGIHPRVLAWLEQRLKPTDRTLETGCGLTTTIFAAAGTDHTCIAPFPDEFDRVSRWCAEQGIATDRIDFLGERSDIVLPGMTGDLDLVLIDGSHAFPQVFVDYWYTAPRLVNGGILIVDDLQLWTGQTLYEFLLAEPGWEMETEWFGKTAAFRKTGEFDPMRSWSKQPYVLKRSAYEGVRAYLQLIRLRKFRWAWERGTTAIKRRIS